MKLTFRLLLLFFFWIGLFAGKRPKVQENLPPFYNADIRWVDSVMASLSLEEKIGQLFMVAAYSNRGEEHESEIVKLVRDQKIGGLIFFQGGPVRQAIQINRYQEAAKVPLLVSIDGEWGLAMRLDSTIRYPRQMALGAIQNDSLIYAMGADIARQCKRLGIHVNFAPVVDINNNPNNPVIGTRSFGEDKMNVTRKAIAYMKGLQDNFILANAKHFPGHGDTESDSHKTLPVIKHPSERLDTLELYPFRKLFEQGLGSVMVAHLYIPSLDATPNQASTLSDKVVKKLLKKEMNFKGLVFTDALNMKGVSKFYEPGVVDAKALIAGNDVLLFAENVPRAIDEIEKAIKKGSISEEEINERCRKILMVKHWAGLGNYKPVDLNNLIKDLNRPEYEALNRRLVESSITLVKNRGAIIPVKRLDTLKVATLNIGDKQVNRFQRMVNNYTKADHYGLNREAQPADIEAAVKKLHGYKLVLVNINNTNTSPAKNFGVPAYASEVIKRISETSKVIVNVAGTPYILSKVPGIDAADGIVISYEDYALTAEYAAQLIFGGIPAKGKLPVTAAPGHAVGAGYTSDNIRLKYSIPEEFKIKSDDLGYIDTLVNTAILNQAFPGCQVLVAKNGCVIYNRSFGYHTYENKKAVEETDLYDVASITKIAATLPAIMKLSDKGLVHLDSTLGKYLPYAKGSNKDSLKLREVLAHHAGLRDWIPYYTSTMKAGQYKEGIYARIPSAEFPHRVASGLYIHKNYRDTIMSKVVASALLKERKYLYSDLGYYFLKDIVERVTEKPFDEYLASTFYEPLGMNHTSFRPIETFPLSEIVPTEYDLHFRKQLVHGDVHDPGAAMLGGVAGHAGLFANANDLAKLMQMYLNKGMYGGDRYLSQSTIEDFTRCQYCDIGNRRGAGFDKPEPDPNKDSPVCRCVSLASYGHSGFTGTLTWADPDHQLVYVFLSNRVYPDAENRKITTMGIRSKIQQVIYDAVTQAVM